MCILIIHLHIDYIKNRLCFRLLNHLKYLIMIFEHKDNLTHSSCKNAFSSLLPSMHLISFTMLCFQQGYPSSPLKMCLCGCCPIFDRVVTYKEPIWIDKTSSPAFGVLLWIQCFMRGLKLFVASQRDSNAMF